MTALHHRREFLWGPVRSTGLAAATYQCFLLPTDVTWRSDCQHHKNSTRKSHKPRTTESWRISFQDVHFSLVYQSLLLWITGDIRTSSAPIILLRLADRIDSWMHHGILMALLAQHFPEPGPKTRHKAAWKKIPQARLRMVVVFIASSSESKQNKAKCPTFFHAQIQKMAYSSSIQLAHWSFPAVERKEWTTTEWYTERDFTQLWKGYKCI
ncbi:uncharacterized protein LOC116654281 [Coturnix japonica]|uniref:uncharacterized protein LOC116654281 n=1 Tax=Coturnix japonica TaxID=93934 RepID=UPI0013A5D19B|nr:uncharacterized protein LOC116654281 [Coturnix japonica]